MNHTNTIQGVGCNLRLEFIDDFLSQKPNVDFLEIIVENWFDDGSHHKKLEQLRQDYPLSFHCVGMNIAGIDSINYDYLKKVNNLKNKYQPFHLSDHLCLQAHQKIHYHDLLPFPMNKESLLSITSRINKIQDYLKASILVENLSSYVEFEESTFSEVQFINQICKTTGCFSLLDINNIWVNEKNLGLKSIDYLKQLNFQYVKEIHLASAESFDGHWIDTHGGALREDVLSLLTSEKSNLKNIPTIFEQDSNLVDLSSLLIEVEKIKGVMCE